MEEFVTFEIAKKLKEKGFIERCFAAYLPYSKKLKLNEIDVDKRPASYKLNITEFRECYNHYVDNNIDAPTISQVLKWLREEKKLHIRASVYFIGWCVDVTNMDGKRMYSTECEYHNYEQAIITGIEYTLDNLI